MNALPFPRTVFKSVETSTSIEPVYNNLVSLSLLSAPESTSAVTWVTQTAAVGPETRRTNRLVWVSETAAAMPSEVRHRNRLVFEVLSDALMTDQEWPDFESYLDNLQGWDATELRDATLVRMLRRLPEPERVEPSALLADHRIYADVLEIHHQDSAIVDLVREAHQLLNEPLSMKELIVGHLREMWTTWLAAEWKRNVMLLSGMVTTLRRRGLPEGTAPEVVRDFIGRELPVEISLLLPDVTNVIFVPSSHVGVYASKFSTQDTLWVFVNTTVLMDWTLRQAPVGRAELLSRLSTLADEARLRILELLAREDELSAQEVMARLELTQSSASRHLSQLRGLGFVVERRGDGASKLYQLNRPQFDWTFRAIEQLLAGEGTELDQIVQPDHPDEIRNFLDRKGRVDNWPAKRKAQQVILRYLADRFETGRRYSEREVNDVLNEWHTFDDPATLRRDMYDEHLLDRTRDGKQYWRVVEGAFD